MTGPKCRIRKRISDGQKRRTTEKYGVDNQPCQFASSGVAGGEPMGAMTFGTRAIKGDVRKQSTNDKANLTPKSQGLKHASRIPLFRVCERSRMSGPRSISFHVLFFDPQPGPTTRCHPVHTFADCSKNSFAWLVYLPTADWLGAERSMDGTGR